MENRSSGNAIVSNTAITLKQLINNLTTQAHTVANKNNTKIVNEIGQFINVGRGVASALNVMKELLSVLVTNSKNGNIHISADRFRDLIILEFQERNNNNGYALAYQINNIEPEAAALGGHISITGPQQKVTTITFSFPNNLQVA